MHRQWKLKSLPVLQLKDGKSTRENTTKVLPRHLLIYRYLFILNYVSIINKIVIKCSFIGFFIKLLRYQMATRIDRFV